MGRRRRRRKVRQVLGWRIGHRVRARDGDARNSRQDFGEARGAGFGRLAACEVRHVGQRSLLCRLSPTVSLCDSLCNAREWVCDDETTAPRRGDRGGAQTAGFRAGSEPGGRVPCVESSVRLMMVGLPSPKRLL